MRRQKTDHNPVAPSENTQIFGNARFQFMTERLVRIEWAADGVFEDRPTLAVVNRAFPAVAWSKEESGSTLQLTTEYLSLTYTNDGTGLSGANLKVEIRTGANVVTWMPGMANRGNLGATIRTLDGVNGNLKGHRVPNPSFVAGGEGETGKEFLWEQRPVDLGNGLLSRDGWAVVDDSRNIVLDATAGRSWVAPRRDGERQDLYLLGYGHDYKSALRDAADVFGRQPLPPRYAFGYWWSRYWAYTDKEIEELVDSFDSMSIPIDVMVIDMDWHLPGWTGYTWDKRYFPDPDEFLATLRGRGLKTTLNLHPADGVARFEDQFEAMAGAMGIDPHSVDKVEFDITDPRYIDAYFKHLHHPEERRGIEFWWMDWQQGESTSMRGLDTLPWINHLHWQDMADNPDRGEKRPLIFSRYGGIGAGRYCIGFSGDTHSNWQSLQFQPRFTATASNVLYGYWSHDIGGHMPGEIEPELYTRWIQFGIFSPILRTHTTKNPNAERRVWEYPAPFNKVMMDAIRQRYEMTPYVYSECRRAFDSGVSLCRPMYYDDPETDAAYEAKDQYMFGDHMLVAPVLGKADERSGLAKVRVWLPEGEWFDTARGCVEQGGVWIERTYLIDEIPVFVRPGTILPGQRNINRLNGKHIADLVLTVYGSGDGRYTLYQDDGVSTDYETLGYAEIPVVTSLQDGRRVITIGSPSGGYDGFAEPTTLEIRIVGSAPPKSVSLGDSELPFAYRLGNDGWRYDGQTATTIIRTSNPGNRIVIETGDDSAADGLKGLLNRLERVGYWNTLASPCHPLHDDERLGVDLAQAGNRIARDRSRFSAEVGRIRECLPALRKMLGELATRAHGDGICGPGDNRYEFCHKAIAILDSLSGS